MKVIAIMMIVTSGMLYQICAKQTPLSVNPFASLIVTYCIALLTTIIFFFSTGKFFNNTNLLQEIKKTNYAAALLGGVIVIYEIGYILAYRANYRASELSAHVTIMIMAIMFIVGLFFYKEIVSVKQIVGLVVASAGILITVL